MRFILLICLLPFLVPAQGNPLDSLKNRLKQNLHDTDRAKTLVRLARITTNRDLSLGSGYLREAIRLFKSQGDLPSLSRAYNQLGSAFTSHAQNDSAIKAYANGLIYGREAQDTLAMIYALVNTGTVYFVINSYNMALEYLLRGLRLAEKSNSVKDLSRAYGNIGNVYKEQGKYKEALAYYKKSRHYAMMLGNRGNLAVNYVNSGNVYYDLAKEARNAAYLDSAYYLYSLGESTILSDPDTAILNMLYVNMANVFADKKQFKQALNLYLKALDMKRRIGEESQLALVYDNLASCYLEMGDPASAEWYIKEGLKAAEASDSYQDMSNLYKDYSEYYKQRKDYEKAYACFVLYKQYADSVINEENIERRTELEMNYSFEKEREQNLLEEREKEVLRKEEKKRSQIYIAITVAGLLITIAIALIIFRNLRLMKRAHGIISAQKDEIEMQKNLVEAKQKEILDSIHYAKRIQRSLLTSEKYIQRQLKGMKN